MHTAQHFPLSDTSAVYDMVCLNLNKSINEWGKNPLCPAVNTSVFKNYIQQNFTNAKIKTRQYDSLVQRSMGVNSAP